jgi:hypothetical protein
MSLVVRTLQSLRPKAQWSLVGEDITWVPTPDNAGHTTPNFEWHDTIQIKPTKDEYLTERDIQEQLIASESYMFLRRKEYPPLADLADALYWQSQGDESKMSAYLLAVQAVKDKYPKGNI